MGGWSDLAQWAAVHFSAVTPWELGITAELGKIVIPDGLSIVTANRTIASYEVELVDARS